MLDIYSYFKDVDVLTEKVNQAIQAESFDDVAHLINERLSTLKSLDEAVASSELSLEQLEEYYAFLKKVQTADQLKVKSLELERNNLHNKSLQQSKNNVAIGKYNSVSRS